MSNYTPGPWRVVGRRILSKPVPHGWNRTDLHDARAPQVEVASFDYRNDFGGSYETFDRDTAQANARLIAAAPEMLAALRTVLRESSEDIGGLDRTELYDAIEAIADIARAAIAAATDFENGLIPSHKRGYCNDHDT